MKLRKVCSFALLLAFFYLPGSSWAQEKRAIAVLDIKARGLDASVAENITDLVVKEVDRVGLFRTISMEEIKLMLEHEQQKILTGCDDTACLAEIGGALGVELLMAGGVGKLGDTYVVSLKLIDVRQAQVLNREERTVSGAIEELVNVSRQAARALLRPIMKQESGTLEVSCSEEGAEVYIDDVMVGSTPLSPRKIPGGYHALKVNKTRFVVYAKDVKIEPQKTTKLNIVLIPSKAFIEEYQSKATTYRTLAWTFTGIAVAAAGSATGLFVWNDGRLSEYEQDREEFELDPTSHDSNELGERADSINLVDSVTIGIVAGALVSGGVSLYFWLAGEPPGRYEKIEDQPKSAFEISGSLGKDSIGATATFRF
jgi:hypothetical protein